MKKIKVLNLYACLGGNRRKWENVNVTAVEIDESLAKHYSKLFPNDKVVVGDAHEYLLNNYDRYDFIWSSPPCPTHSLMNKTMVSKGKIKPRYADLTLYQEIIFLKEWFKGGFVVENVIPYYEQLIPCDKKLERHLFWCNFGISNFRIKKEKAKIGGKGTEYGTVKKWEKYHDIDLDGVPLNQDKTKVLRNMVHYSLGEHIFNCYLGKVQKKESKQLRII